MLIAARMQIEAAYDTLFMQSMKRRLSGELEVSTSVRYADVPTPKKRGSGGGAQVSCPAAAGCVLWGLLPSSMSPGQHAAHLAF